MSATNNPLEGIVLNPTSTEVSRAFREAETANVVRALGEFTAQAELQRTTRLTTLAMQNIAVIGALVTQIPDFGPNVTARIETMANVHATLQAQTVARELKGA